MSVKKVIRTATIALSLDVLLKGQLEFLSKHYEVIAVSGGDNYLENVREREKIKVKTVEIQRNIAPLKDIQSLLLLYQLFKKEKPYIVHSITPKAGLLSMLAAKFAGVPVRIHTFTGLIFPAKTGIMQKVLINMDRLLCWSATLIIPEGQGVKNDLINYKITSKPLKILANGNVNGIDTAYFDKMLFSEAANQSLRQQLKIAPDDFVFIFVGRLVGDKGVNELITAFKNITSTALSDHPSTGLSDPALTACSVPASTTFSDRLNLNLKLLLVGPYEQELDALNSDTLQEIDQNPNIISVGFQPDVRPYFALADALVFPSYREGFPNVVLQAGAMELPAVVSDINGCNEIIKEGENGLIIPSKDAEALKEAMLKLITNAELYHHLKQNARPRIVQNYEQAVVWQAILEEYRKAEHHV